MPADILEKAATAEEARRGVSRISSIVTDAVEDGVRSASRAIRHGRYAAEDVIDQAEHKVKQRPLQAMGMAFAAGILVGGFLGWIAFRHR